MLYDSVYSPEHASTGVLEREHRQCRRKNVQAAIEAYVDALEPLTAKQHA